MMRNNPSKRSKCEIEESGVGVEIMSGEGKGGWRGLSPAKRLIYYVDDEILISILTATISRGFRPLKTTNLWRSKKENWHVFWQGAWQFQVALLSSLSAWTSFLIVNSPCSGDVDDVVKYKLSWRPGQDSHLANLFPGFCPGNFLHSSSPSSVPSSSSDESLSRFPLLSSKLKDK